MVDPQTSRFWRVAVQSGLLDVASIQACWDQLPEEKRTPDAIDRRLARQAVNAGFITVWQAQQLMTGRASGFKIDRYVLVDLLGQGGMGRVYLAKDTRLGRQVAIKVLSTSRMNNPRAIARFQREGKVGAQLQHENLVRIYDEGESATIRYLVMEYIEGKNIAQLIGEQGAIAWAAAVRLTRQIALGLEHAHQKGLIHRDVNPSNILVTRDGTAKLTDLGLAIDLADEGNVTRDGATVGTFDYISPEQAKHSREVDTRSDIYSLGCTLYHMIAGRVPFPMPSLPEKLYAHQLHDPDPLYTLVNDVPEGLSRVVSKMMAKKPEDRYATPHAVAVALEPYVDEAARLKPSALTMTRSVSGEFPAEAGKTRVAAPVKLNAPEGETSAAAKAPDVIPTTNEPETQKVKNKPSVAASGAVSDPDLAIFSVDTGPDEPLTASLQSSNRQKAKARISRTKTSDSGENNSSSPPKKSRKVPIAAGISGVVVLAVVLGVVFWKPKDSKTLPKPSNTAVDNTQKKKSASEEISPPTTKPLPSTGARIVFRNQRGSERVFTKLSDAVQVAARDKGDVILNNSTPLRLTSADAFRVGNGGDVTIRGEEGTSPIIAYDASNTTSLITVLPSGSLTLKGLTFIAHYQLRDQTPGTFLPIIESAGSLHVENSTFVAKSSVVRTSAIHHQGPKLEINGSLFNGFNRSVDFEAYPDSQMKMSQCMMVRTEGNTGVPGWGVRVQLTTTRAEKKNATRRVIINHSTVTGGGVLDVSGFTPSHPLTVSLENNAIQTRALLNWTPAKDQPEKNWLQSLKWVGKANLYDITSASWVFIKPDSEIVLPDAPTDLKAWSDLFKTEEGSKSQSFKFATDPHKVPPERATDPAVFGLVGEGTSGFGADPKKVGRFLKQESLEAPEKPTETKKPADLPEEAKKKAEPIGEEKSKTSKS